MIWGVVCNLDTGYANNTQKNNWLNWDAFVGENWPRPTGPALSNGLATKAPTSVKYASMFLSPLCIRNWNHAVVSCLACIVHSNLAYESSVHWSIRSWYYPHFFQRCFSEFANSLSSRWSLTSMCAVAGILQQTSPLPWHRPWYVLV